MIKKAIFSVSVFLLRSKYAAACRGYFTHGVSKGKRRLSPLVAEREFTSRRRSIKEIKIPRLLAAGIFICSMAFADFQFVNGQYNHPFVEFGGSGYYLNNSEFKLGTVSGGNAPLVKMTNNGITPQWNLGLGYQFLNCSDNALTRMFGNEESVELKADYFNKVNRTTNGNPGTGSIYFIDTGAFITGNSTPLLLHNLKLSDRQRRTNVGLYFKSHRYTTNPKVTLTPYAGLVYTDYRDFYQYFLAYAAPAYQTDTEKYTIDVNYYGPSFGNRLTYNLTTTLAAFTDVEAQLLHANADLSARQDPVSRPAGSFNTRIVKDDDSMGITYRTILTAGLDYNFKANPNGLAIELMGGLDRWGYKPVVITPNANNSTPAHLHGDTQNNGFVMLNVTVPLTFI